MQTYFVLVLAVVGIIFITALLWWVREQWREFWPVLVGMAVLVIFVVIRAASFDHVNYFLGRWRKVGPIRMKYVVELAGVVIVGLGAARQLPLGRREGLKSKKKAQNCRL